MGYQLSKISPTNFSKLLMRKRNLLSTFLLVCIGGIFNFMQAQNFPATCGGAIPDNACLTPNYDTCRVTVSGVGVLGTVNILEKVCVDITHTWDADVEVQLVAPDGTAFSMFADVGGSGDDFTGTCLTDAATTPIASGAAPFTGDFIPANPLSGYNGIDADGDWELLVCDDAGGDFGTVNSFDLTFAPPPSCPSPTGLAVANVLAMDADISWTPGASSTAFTIEICPAGIAQGDATCITETAGAVSGPITITGLTPETDYETYLWEECSGEITDTLGPEPFTTLATCPAPTGFFVDNETETSADANWTSNGIATGFVVEVCPTGTAQGDATCLAFSTGASGGPVALTG